MPTSAVCRVWHLNLHTATHCTVMYLWRPIPKLDFVWRSCKLRPAFFLLQILFGFNVHIVVCVSMISEWYKHVKILFYCKHMIIGLLDARCWVGFWIVCRIFITLGVILLVSSARLMALLPRPLRRHLRRSNLENHTLRRSGSLRIKDPSPSAVIHASTLHHLITSPSKEKA